MPVGQCQPIYPKPKTSRPHPAHKVYPYLLKDMTIDQPNQVWSADNTYIPMNRGHMYLVAVMDWHSRKVLLDTAFCVEALNEVLERFVRPQIFNTGQGARFTSNEFTSTLKASGIAISMDGRGRCQDNIFIERLWWTFKYQYLYLHSFVTGAKGPRMRFTSVLIIEAIYEQSTHGELADRVYCRPSFLPCGKV